MRELLPTKYVDADSPASWEFALLIVSILGDLPDNEAEMDMMKFLYGNGQ
jgi:hypothetical protein